MQGDHGSLAVPNGRPGERPQRVAAVDVLRAPGHHERQVRPRESPGEEREQVDRARVGPLRVVDDEHAAPPERADQGPHDALDEPRLRARAVERRRLGAGRREVGHQPRRLVTPLRPHRVPGSGRRRRCRAQGARHRRVRQAGLALEAPDLDDRGAEGPRGLVDQPGLPDPALALDDQQMAVRHAAPDRGQGLVERIGPPDQGELANASGRLGRGGGELGRRRRPALDDRVVQLRRLLERGHPQLPFQDADALPVLLHRRRTVAGRGVQRHQPPVNGFAERVEREQPAGVLDGLRGEAGPGARVDQPFQGLRDLPGDPLRLEPLPVVELGAVAEREPVHEPATGQCGGPPEGPDAVATRRSGLMAVFRA